LSLDGNIHTDRALIQVFDSKELDALLQAEWKAMKGALRQGDIVRAVDYITIKKRTGYQRIFEALTIPLANIDQVLTDITLVTLRTKSTMDGSLED
jgi:hypothetical protein